MVSKKRMVKGGIDMCSELWLIWQNPNSRQHYHVGTLKHLDDGYTFKYTNNLQRRGVKDALADGYTLHFSFQKIDKSYHWESMPAVFMGRMPDRKRVDIDEILESFSLKEDCTDMELLRATGGRQATDTYYFVSPPDNCEEGKKIQFYLAGWSHYKENLTFDLSADSQVVMKKETTNERDPKAISLYVNDQKIGFVPAFYCECFFEVLDDGNVRSRILNFNKNAIPQLQVLIETKF